MSLDIVDYVICLCVEELQTSQLTRRGQCCRAVLMLLWVMTANRLLRQ